MKFPVSLWALVCVMLLCGAAHAQDVQNDPVWKALVAGDKAIESGVLTFTQNGPTAAKSGIRSHVYSYAPGGLFRDAVTGVKPKAAPFTMGFDGQDAWMNVALGTNLGPKKWSRDWGYDVNWGHAGLTPRASFSMGRGLSFLQNPRVERQNGQINVTGQWVASLPYGVPSVRGGKPVHETIIKRQSFRVVATVDPQAHFLARRIALFESNSQPFLFWTTSGALADGRIAANSVSHLKSPQGTPINSFAFTSARFGSVPASTFAPKIHGVNVYDFRVNEGRPAFYFGGMPEGLSRSQALADTSDYVANQNALQTRNTWMTRWGIGGIAVAGLALLSGVLAGVVALWSRRKTKTSGTPTRSKWASRFIVTGAICAWGFVVAAWGFFHGWTPASFAANQVDLVAQQSQLASHVGFGAIKRNDKRLKSAFTATDLVTARRMRMKSGAFVGIVSNVRQTRRDDVALDFATDRSLAVRAVISPAALSRFPDLRKIIGTKVYVSGAVMPHENRAEIVLHAPSQLLVVQ